MIKKSEMNAETTYILCPDTECQLFFDTSRPLQCEDKCPRKDETKKIVKCFSCGELVELSGDHSWMRRVDCTCGAQNFQRMSGKYYFIRGRGELAVDK
jgi:hypothetical protein